MKKIFLINKKDNVAVALTGLAKGEYAECGNKNIKALENIARGHKIAADDIPKGTDVIKYGYPIGHATKDISCGEWVHSHNMKTNLDTFSENYKFTKHIQKNDLPVKPMTFYGYRRFDGRAGIRNELWIVPTVGCVNGTGRQILQKFRECTKKIYADNIKVLEHPYGCSQLGDDLSFTRRILADFIKHPNAGGVLVLALGCENNTLDSLKEEMGEYDKSRVRFLRAQDPADEISEGVRALEELNQRIGKDRREELPFSKLCVGVKCGGSDGFSGITANPIIGRFTDFLTAQGGTVVQTEVPEMFGAETVLMNRARDNTVFDKVVKLINNFKQYYIKSGQPVYENPSPGNKAGGITTLEEKSLGCVQKSGSSEVEDVLNYADTIKRSGLNLLCAPGNDLVSSAALAASGCGMILFSTGRGTPYGTVVPTVKISTNTQLFESKHNWIDFNAGSLLENTESDDMLCELVKLVQKAANGSKTCSEANGFGSIAIWKNGVTL